MPRVNVRLKQSDYDALDRLVIESNLSASEHVRRALEAYINPPIDLIAASPGALPPQLQSSLDHLHYVSLITSFVVLAMAQDSEPELANKAIAEARNYARANGIPVVDTGEEPGIDGEPGTASDGTPKQKRMTAVGDASGSRTAAAHSMAGGNQSPLKTASGDRP
jgi:hypothetical protein